MQNLRDRLYDLYDELCCRVSFFFHKLRGSRRRPMSRGAVLRGTAHSIISVTPPDTEMFREALFILQDDFLRGAGETKELLQQAREAAERFSAQYVPPEREKLSPLALVLPVLTAAAGFLLGRAV